MKNSQLYISILKLPKFKFEQTIGQLEKRKGGYFYLTLDADIVNQFERKRATRLLCTLDDKLTIACGLNHLGDGNFFIIVATKYMKKIGRKVGDVITFEITEDPNPLGVEIPEVLTVLLEQDEDAKNIFDQLTDGKKRSLIYTIMRTKNIDKQVETVLEFLEKEWEKIQKKKTK